MLKKLFIIFVILSAVTASPVFAQEEEPAGDEGGTFVTVAPDALIVLDLSGSMSWNPAGGSNIWGDSSCNGPFYWDNSSPHNVNCSRIAIAKRALFSILDDDNNNTIDSQDMNSLQVRIGYMRFYNCGGEETTDYTKGCNKLVTTISALGKDTGTSYSLTYCGNSTSCASTVTSCTSGSCIVGEGASGGTPINGALTEAKLYLDAHKDKDSAKSCRQKFVILITDGADTYACSGNGGECQEHMYKRRRQTIAAAKALNDAGYKVFVMGFGSSMPDYLKNTLNWTAYYGGTDNPLETNSGSESAYDPATITACQTDTATETKSDCGSSTSHFKATNSDPGYLSLSGYAFLAANADDLTTALRSAISTIREATYSFTQSSIQAVRTIDENYLYEASFTPSLAPNNDPFWVGHLKRYSIDEAGDIAATADWDAGSILDTRDATTRVMYTYKIDPADGVSKLMLFNSTNITMADLGVTTDATRLAIINFIRGGEQSGANAGWKLGDIYHSSPVTIGTPSPYFYDRIDTADTKAFDTHRANHDRPSSSGKRLILAGANDGQFHAFKAGESSVGGGSELWSFIPPNLLTKLTTIAHSTHPTSLGHQYFVDGPISASDVWLGSGSGATKSASDWHTLLTFALGRGGTTHLWSSSASCASGVNSTYSSTYPYYCGYYAFDITETLNAPTFMWHLGGTTALTATEGGHLGQPWSKMIMGRVKIDGNEKWVGFIGAGYAGTDCKGGGTCDTRGKGFYVVNLSTGAIIWKYTHSGPDGTVNGDMDYSLAGPAALIDTDNDGFVDTAYIGDLGGDVWRFKFCLGSDASCGTSNWSGGMLYEASSGNIRPIYTMPTVAKDDLGNMWVYFGTGDITDPTASNAQEKMYGVKDNDRATKYTISDLDNITTGTYSSTSTKAGWYINLTGSGQKILAEPTVFQGILYFTTYNPASASDPCASGGEASLWAVDYKSGAGMFDSGARSTVIGSGIPSAPVISLNPYGGTNIYASTSEGSGTGAHTQNIDPPSSQNLNRSNLLYWHDLRVQP
ncbi:MAG: Neisseria PilC protein [Smithella sp. PtaU1.Bin162]|nr:MAG: Neisseria PilC protein [Smithella sp. PtaU1.Bin162]